MPKVGGKHYPYTPKGIAMAKNKAKKEGKKVDYSKKKKKVVKASTKKPRKAMG
jgi:hypothetical protein